MVLIGKHLEFFIKGGFPYSVLITDLPEAFDYIDHESLLAKVHNWF